MRRMRPIRLRAALGAVAEIRVVHHLLPGARRSVPCPRAWRAEVSRGRAAGGGDASERGHADLVGDQLRGHGHVQRFVFGIGRDADQRMRGAAGARWTSRSARCRTAPPPRRKPARALGHHALAGLARIHHAQILLAGPGRSGVNQPASVNAPRPGSPPRAPRPARHRRRRRARWPPGCGNSFGLTSTSSVRPMFFMARATAPILSGMGGFHQYEADARDVCAKGAEATLVFYAPSKPARPSPCMPTSIPP